MDYIVFYIAGIIAILLWSIYMTIWSEQLKCSALDNLEYPPFVVSNLSSVPIKDLMFKSAYNCCCVGNMKNDYVSLCALDNCYRSGARVLDLQIFSLNGQPVVSASSVNQNEYKEMYNYLSFSETILYMKNKFLNTAQSLNNQQVFILNLRIHSNNRQIYDKMAQILIDAFTGNSQIWIPADLKEGDKDLNLHTLNELKNKIIIMVDLNASPNMREHFSTTTLSGLALITFGDGFKYHALHANEASLQSGVELTALYPTKTYFSNNYDYNDKGVRNKFNFIFMNLQKNDAFSTSYLDAFGGASFKQVYNLPT